ncbi:MAG: FtsX-like permease family protein [Acidobacteria bacterium]|nr:FtsX-like permease family protein [Acidobacteriota bacterium]
MSEVVFRLALGLYPHRIRARFGAEMLDYMRANYERRRTWRDRVAYWRAFAADLVRALLATWADRDPRTVDLPMMSFFRDLVRAGRDFLRQPGFALPAAVTLVIGIGTTAAVFALLNAIVLAPLPYPDSDSLVVIFEQNSPTNRFNISTADFLGMEEMQRSLEAVAAFTVRSPVLAAPDQPQRVRAAVVTADFFDVLQTQPAQGRGFAPGEDREGASEVAVLSAALRDTHFGVGGEAVGQTIDLDGTLHTVVGVMDAAHRGPIEPAVDLWVALQLVEPGRRGPFFMRGLGRLKGGSDIEKARTDLADVSRRLYQRWPGFDENAMLTPYSLHEIVVGSAGGRLGLVFAAVLLVLIVAIANVVNLVLARSVARSGEFAVRAAVGASRWRLARLLLADGLVLASVGGAGGLVLAWIALKAFQAAEPGLPRLTDATIGFETGAFVAGLSAFAALIFAVAPLALTSGTALLRGLRAGGRGSVSSRATRRLRTALVAIEFALVLPLVVGGSLLTLSLLKLSQVDPGFEPRDVVAVSVSLPAAAYADPALSEIFWRAAATEMAELPGVVSVGISQGLPPDSPATHNNFDLVDRPVVAGTSQPVTPWVGAGDNFLDVLELRLVDGRWFDEALDGAGDENTPWNLVVTESWARRFYPDESAIGKQIYSGGDRSVEHNIVGVIGDVKYDGLAGDGQTLYFPVYRFWQRSMSLVVRTNGAPVGLADSLDSIVASLDANLPPADIETMDSRLGASISGQRLWTRMLVFFAASALLLTAVGLFGVLAHLVRQQTQEIGVRMALGADRLAIVRMVLSRGLLIAAGGMAVGLGLSFAASRTLESLLFGVGRNDPTALVVACAGLLAVAVAAAYLPARRASRTDPVRAINSA